MNRGGLDSCDTWMITHCLINRLNGDDDAVRLTRRPRVVPKNIFLYSFFYRPSQSLGRTEEKLCKLKKQILSPDRISNSGHSGLWHSASANYSTASPNEQ
jgi:hypothetical protein